MYMNNFKILKNHQDYKPLLLFLPVSQKKTGHPTLSHNFANVDRFYKFFHCHSTVNVMKHSLNIPPHLKCIVTVPCEM